MAWENANRVTRVHLYYSLRLNVEKRLILLDHCTKGWDNCIGIRIADNTTKEESMAEYSIRTENSDE